MIPKTVIAWLSAAIAAGALVAFAVIFGLGVVQVWSASAGQPPHYNEPFLGFATAIGAFVGGIVAVAFGLKPAPQVNQTILVQNLRSLGAVPLVQDQARVVLGALYAIVYVALGFAAVATLLAHPHELSDLVTNLATTFLGLALPIAGAFFSS
jgi:hypothetical protein